ncbi:hypothetical protein C8Q77DRAFT_1157152 [Trametes polyzona]|nr:hypothetical protein C8Q77DRAFT_1157152 [Trametes polyzona]
MRTFALLSFLAFAASTIAASTDVPGLDLPPCGEKCLQANAGVDDCKNEADLHCVCGNPLPYRIYLTCILGECSPLDFRKALDAYERDCELGYARPHP